MAYGSRRLLSQQACGSYKGAILKLHHQQEHIQRTMSIGSRIKEAREKARISQAQLARQLNITRSACSQWESEVGTAPRRERLEQIAEILGVSYEWLATGKPVVSSPMPAGVEEEQGRYVVPLRADQRELLEIFNRLSVERRSALLELLRTL